MVDVIYDTNGEYVKPTSNLSVCPFCKSDWYQAKKREFDSLEETTPMFKTVIKPTEYPTTRLATLVWGVKCYSCGESHVRIMQLSPLFNGEYWDGDTYVGPTNANEM